MELKNKLKKTLRNSVRLKIAGTADIEIGVTRFGGKPDLPDGFEWRRFSGENSDGETKKRPLSFIAQFNLGEISEFDTDNLLPKKGLLSFFYDAETIKRGQDPKDSGCGVAFYFEDISKLKSADFPSDLSEELRFPPIGIKAKTEDSYQDYPDFLLQRDKLLECWDDYDRAARGLKINKPDIGSKLLGWPDILRDNMTVECELVSRGYCLSEGLGSVTPRDRQEAVQSSAKEWLLLFQLDSAEVGGFGRMLGDGGRIYYYIRKEDLSVGRFDRVWTVTQRR